MLNRYYFYEKCHFKLLQEKNVHLDYDWIVDFL